MEKKTSKIAQAIPFPFKFVRSSTSRLELWQPKMLFASDVTRCLFSWQLGWAGNKGRSQKWLQIWWKCLKSHQTGHYHADGPAR